MATTNLLVSGVEDEIRARVVNATSELVSNFDLKVQGIMDRVKGFEDTTMGNLKNDYIGMQREWTDALTAHNLGMQKELTDTLTAFKTELRENMVMAGSAAENALKGEFQLRDGLINSLTSRLDEALGKFDRADPMQAQDPWGTGPARNKATASSTVFHDIATPVASPQKPRGAGGSGPGGDGQGPPGSGGGGHGGGYNGGRGGAGGAPHITLYSKVFEDKIAQDPKNQYNGSADSGPSWRIFTRNYLMGAMPEVKMLLKWAEERQYDEIKEEDVEDLQRNSMLENGVAVMSHHVWRYLNLNLTGDAKTIHNNTSDSNGLEIWRKLTLDITSKSAARRRVLHDHVYNPRSIDDLKHVKMAVERWGGDRTRVRGRWREDA